MDNTAMQELESFLKMYNNKANGSDSAQSSNVEQEIKELLDIVKNKLEHKPRKQRIPKSMIHQSTHIKQPPNSPVTSTSEQIWSSSASSSDKSFWNDMLNVLSNAPNNHKLIQQSKSTGNICFDSTDAATDTTESIERDLLNTALLNAKRANAINVCQHLNHSKSEFKINATNNDHFVDDTDYSALEDRAKSIIDNYHNNQQNALKKEKHSSKKRIKKLQNAAKNYLDKNGIKMSNDVRQEFLEDFRDSVDQIRTKIHCECNEKMENLTKQFRNEINSVLTKYESDLKHECKQQIEDTKGRLLSQRATNMKFVRDKHDKLANTMLNKVRNELELENEARLSKLQNIMINEREKEVSNLKLSLSQTFNARCATLKGELSQNKAQQMKMVQTSMKIEFENKSQALREENDEKFEEFKMNLQNQYSQKMVTLKMKLSAKYNEKIRKLKMRLAANHQRLQKDTETKLKIVHEARTKEMDRECKDISFRMNEESKIKLQNQETDLKHLRVQKMEIVKKHCLAEYDKVNHANKLMAESEFQKEKLSLMEAMDKDFKQRTKTEIAEMKKEFDDKNGPVLAAYKKKLQIALKADVNKQRQILKDKETKKLDEMEQRFKQQKQRWFDKINGAAVANKRSALKILECKLEKDKKKSVADLCQKIQREKESAINRMREEHEEQKRIKMNEIKNKYLNDASFPESMQILEINDAMKEEINLLERFEMFAKRIKSLQEQIKIMNTPKSARNGTIPTPISLITSASSPSKRTFVC